MLRALAVRWRCELCMREVAATGSSDAMVAVHMRCQHSRSPMVLVACSGTATADNVLAVASLATTGLPFEWEKASAGAAVS